MPVLRWPRSGFVPPKESPVSPPKTWLLRIGWRRLGLLTASDEPEQDFEPRRELEVRRPSLAGR
jgi:hypothetical protein